MLLGEKVLLSAKKCRRWHSANFVFSLQHTEQKWLKRSKQHGGINEKRWPQSSNENKAVKVGIRPQNYYFTCGHSFCVKICWSCSLSFTVSWHNFHYMRRPYCLHEHNKTMQMMPIMSSKHLRVIRKYFVVNALTCCWCFRGWSQLVWWNSRQLS